MPVIYHIASIADWNAAKQNGVYEHPALKNEGFIHCSLDHQILGVLARYFSGRNDLLKLTIDTDKLSSKCVYDWSGSNSDTYPNIYGTINTDAVIKVEEIKR
jgi:uncharacterized protein (DUF952 family)